MHVDSGDLQRLLHGELPAMEVAEVRAHLDVCATCRDEALRTEREEAEVTSLLAKIDHTPPDVQASTLIADGGRTRVHWMRWAAGIALGMGISGVAYAAPGSPVPGWVSAFAEQIVGTQTAPVTGVGVTDDGSGEGRGIRVDPGDRLVIDVSGVSEGSLLEVVLSGAPEVEASGVSTALSFTVDPGQLAIEGLGPDTIRIVIPISAPYVQIRANQRTAVVKDGESLSTPDGDLTGAGPFRVPLFPESP